MKALIANPTDPTGAAAALGFELLGWDVEAGMSSTYDPEVVQVGDVRGLQRLFAWARLPIRCLADPPQEIRMWFGREHQIMPLSEALLVAKERPVFLKSVSPKLTDPVVLGPDSEPVDVGYHFMHVEGSDPKMVVQAPRTFTSEFRVMVNAGEIVAIRQYRGDPVKGHRFLGQELTRVERIVGAVSRGWGPVACAVDVGIVETDCVPQVLLVEVNDAWALGDYGTPPPVYAKMLAARWAEIGRGGG